MALLGRRRKIAEHEEKHHVSLELKLNEVLQNQLKHNNKLNLILKNQQKMAQTHEELLAGINSANTKVDKIKTEIQALKDAVANSNNVPAAVEEAANQLFTNLQSADDMNEDAQA